MLVGLSAYQNSKLAMVKTMEYLSLENPNIFCSAVHPGMVDTGIFRKSGATPDMLPMDTRKFIPLIPSLIEKVLIDLVITAELAAAFMTWVSLPEAEFLNGRFVYVNWDVEELKEKAEQISSGIELTAGILGWPFPHVGAQ